MGAVVVFTRHEKYFRASRAGSFGSCFKSPLIITEECRGYIFYLQAPGTYLRGGRLRESANIKSAREGDVPSKRSRSRESLLMDDYLMNSGRNILKFTSFRVHNYFGKMGKFFISLSNRTRGTFKKGFTGTRATDRE